MDELMKTKAFRTIMSKILTRAVRKAYGDNIKIYVKDLTVNYDKNTNKVNILANVEGETTPETIQGIIFSE